MEKFGGVGVFEMGLFQLRPVLLCYELRDDWNADSVGDGSGGKRPVALFVSREKVSR